MKRTMMILIGMMAAVGPVFAQSGGSFEIQKSVIASGGGRSFGGIFTSEGTVAEALAGITSTGGSFSLSSGFWSGVAPAGTPTPTPTPTATPTATPTPTTTPTVTPTPTPTPPGSGFEGDVGPRFSGDGQVISTDVTLMRRFATGLDIPNPGFNEFQRADSAPRATLGDGIINSGDVVQTRRYATGLDPLTDAGGPISLAFQPLIETFQASRELQAASGSAKQGGSLSVPITLNGEGDEMAMVFTIMFDPFVLTRPTVTLGPDAPGGSTITVNDTVDGQLTILIDSSNVIEPNFERAADIANVMFEVADGAPIGPTRLAFRGDQTALSDPFGRGLKVRSVDGTIMIEPRETPADLVSMLTGMATYARAGRLLRESSFVLVNF